MTISKKCSLKKRSAFSLIELSIVLIIIGLLIGAVTGGASLIKSAKLRSVMSESRNYNIVVRSFYVKYDDLPGDYGSAVSGSATGNANGRIELVNSDNEPEGGIAWEQLINANITPAGYTPITADVSGATLSSQTPSGSSANIPASKFKGAGWAFDNIDSFNYVIFTGPTGDITHTANAVTNYPSTDDNGGILLPEDANSIDSKVDDGLPQSGEVRGYGEDHATNTTRCTDGASTPEYASDETTPNCALGFRIDL